MRDLSKHVNGEGIQNWKLALIPDQLGRVLDAGSGVTEPYRSVLEACSKSYVSVDLRPGTMVQADVTRLPFSDSTFDYCWASELMEHLGGRITAEKALSEMKRVSKHGCATWPTPANPNFTADPGHIDPELTPSKLHKTMAILEW